MTVVALIIAVPASDSPPHGGLLRGWSTAASAEVCVWFGSVTAGTNLC